MRMLEGAGRGSAHNVAPIGYGTPKSVYSTLTQTGRNIRRSYSQPKNHSTPRQGAAR